jgi:hypothetical protein
MHRHDKISIYESDAAPSPPSLSTSAKNRSCVRCRSTTSIVQHGAHVGGTGSPDARSGGHQAGHVCPTPRCSDALTSIRGSISCVESLLCVAGGFAHHGERGKRDKGVASGQLPTLIALDIFSDQDSVSILPPSTI